MMFRRRAFLATTLTAALAGCGSSVSAPAPTTGGNASIEISNCASQLSLPSPPTAVVGLHPAQTELLLRLGLADVLVGQAQATVQELPSDVAELAAEVPVLGGDAPPSREELLSVAPDFVYSPTTYEFSGDQGFATLEQLEQAGTAVYIATGGCADRRMNGTVKDLFEDLENLGTVFDRADRSAELIGSYRQMLSDVASALEGRARPRAAQVFIDGTTLSAIGAGVEHDIMTLAGAAPVFSPDQELFADFFAAQISAEALAAEQPEALVFGVKDAAHEEHSRHYLGETFPNLPAVVEGRLVAVPSTQLFPGTIGNITSVQQIAEGLHPDAF